MPRYKIRIDGKEYGPIEQSQLRQWITEGRIHSQTEISTENQANWCPISGLPEFKDISFQSPPPKPPPPPTPDARLQTAPYPHPITITNQRQGMAITSMVLGISSVVCMGGILTGIPAIIMGHIAYRRARKDPGSYGGAGFAMVGLILGYFSLVVTTLLLVLLPFLAPSLAKSKTKAQEVQCANQMKQLFLAARLYANDHDETLPPDFISMTNWMPTPKILVCPSDEEHLPALLWEEFDPQANVTYEYQTPGIKESIEANKTVVFFCPIHENEGYGDGSVLRLQSSRSMEESFPTSPDTASDAN